MLKNSDKPRCLVYNIVLTIALTISVIVLFFLIQNIDPNFVVYGDYIQYWASGRLLLYGDNPYSWDLIEDIKMTVGHINLIDKITPSMFRYPPWSLIFVIPIGLMDYEISRVVWLLSHILIIYISTLLLWNIYGGKLKYRWFAVAIAFTFAPTLFVLGIGHFTTLHLLGATLFLYFTNNPHYNGKNSDFLAGFCCSLISVKPNVLLLFLFSLLIWSFLKKRWFILLGILVNIFIGLLVAFIFNNQVITQYWEVISKYSPALWDTPTLGMLLRHYFGLEMTWLLIFPTIVGLVWMIFYIRKNLQRWNWINKLSIIIFLSIISSPYIWTYDMVVLLIPIIHLFSRISNDGINTATITIISVYAFLNIITFILHLYFHDFWFFWLAPTYLAWFLLGMESIKNKFQVQIT